MRIIELTMKILSMLAMVLTSHQTPPSVPYKVYVFRVVSELGLFPAKTQESALAFAKVYWQPGETAYHNGEVGNWTLALPAVVGDVWHTKSDYPEAWKGAYFADRTISQIKANQDNPTLNTPFFYGAASTYADTGGIPYYSLNAGVKEPVGRDDAKVITLMGGESFWPVYRHQIASYAVVVNAISQYQAEESVKANLIRGVIYKAGHYISAAEATQNGPMYTWGSLLSNSIDTLAYVYTKAQWGYQPYFIANAARPALPAPQLAMKVPFLQIKDIGPFVIITKRPLGDVTNDNPVPNLGKTVISNR